MFISLYAVSRELSNSFMNIVPMVTLFVFSKIFKHSRKYYLIVTFILQYAISRKLPVFFFLIKFRLPFIISRQKLINKNILIS